MRLCMWTQAGFLALCYIPVTNLLVFADQCAYVDKAKAVAAISRLNLGQTVYQFCQLCGDRQPMSLLIDALSAGTTGYQDFWQVKINGSTIDLAYTSIDAGIQKQRVNLAAVVGCSAVNVSTVSPQP